MIMAGGVLMINNLLWLFLTDHSVIGERPGAVPLRFAMKGIAHSVKPPAVSPLRPLEPPEPLLELKKTADEGPSESPLATAQQEPTVRPVAFDGGYGQGKGIYISDAF